MTELSAEASALERKQQKGIWLTVASIVFVITLFMAMFLNKMFSPRVMSPEELQANGAIVFDAPRIVNDFALFDHQGEPFDLDNFKGQWSIIYFGFTHCPDICPMTLAKLDQVYKQLDPDIAANTQVLLLTVDPARDTPEKLAQYVAHFNPLFKGVTGDFVEIMKLTRNVNVAFNKVMLNDGEDYTVDHTGNLVLINPLGHYHAFFRPPFELARLKTTYQSIVTQF